MPDYTLEKIGKPFFRVRKYASTTVILVAIFIVLYFGGPIFDDPAMQLNYSIFWGGIAVLGALVRIVANGYAAPGTSGEGKKEAEAATLNTTGAYSLVRNPLYVGRILTFTGIAFFSNVWQYGVVVMIGSIYFFHCVIAYEEQFLRGRFGDAYEDWYHRVPSLIPKISGWVTPDRKWWWRRLFFRETYKVLDLATTLGVGTVLTNYVVTGGVYFNPLQLAMLFGIPVLYLTKTSLKRFTSAFDEIK